MRLPWFGDACEESGFMWAILWISASSNLWIAGSWTMRSPSPRRTLADTVMPRMRDRVASRDWARSCLCHFVQGPAKGGKALLDAFAQHSESVQADCLSSSGFPTVTSSCRVAHPRPRRARREVWRGRLLRSVERQESFVDLCEVELVFRTSRRGWEHVKGSNDLRKD